MIKARTSLKLLTLLVVAVALAFPLFGAAARSLGIGSVKAFQLGCKPLEGFSTTEKAPPLTAATWLDGTFQKQFDDWFTGSFGARNFLVRLNNQLLYTAFRRSYMCHGWLVVADHDVLYELGYIK